MDRHLCMGKKNPQNPKTKTHGYSCLHVNVHQMVVSAKEYFNNQMDRIIYSVDTSQALFLVTLVIAQRAHK